MIELKRAQHIETMRRAGELVARTLTSVREASHAGVALTELDDLAHSVITGGGGVPTFLGYHPRFAPTPYPATICTSVNDVIVHGIPDRYRLRTGDLVSIDCAAHVDGFCADSAVSYVVGGPEANPAAAALIDVTVRALEAGIAAAAPMGRLGDISAAIGLTGRTAGYGIPEDFGGHGIGRQMHEEPSVSNTGTPGRGLRLRPGLALALEPMFMAGGRDEYRVDGDGWSLRTIDGSLAAHAEHTIAIGEDGVSVLTR